MITKASSTSQNISNSQGHTRETSRDTNETRSTTRLGQPKTLNQQTKSSKADDKRARTPSGKPGPASRPFLSDAPRAYQASKGKKQIDKVDMATLKQAAYEAALEKNQNRSDIYSREVIIPVVTQVPSA